MKKVLVLMVVISLVVGLFAGCGRLAAPSDEPETDPAPERKNVTISFMASQDWVFQAEQDLGAKFEKETGIKVDYQIVPSDQYQKLLMTKLNAGEDPDLFGNQSGKFDIVSLLDIEKNGVDLSGEEWAKRMNPLVAEQLTVNGKLYGMTVADVSAVWGIAYNKNIFSKLGLSVPTTFAEFKDVCQKIKDSGVIPIYEPVSDGWHHVLWFPELGGRYECYESFNFA